MQNQTVSDDTHAKDRSRFKSMRDEGAAIDERIAMQICNYKFQGLSSANQKNGRYGMPLDWNGSLKEIRQDVAVLAANPAMTAAVGCVGSDPESEEMQRLSALAVVRVNVMHACLSVDDSNAVLSNAKFPAGLLIGLAAASLARMPIDDSYEAQYRPRFTELTRAELQAAIDTVASDSRPTELYPIWVLTLNGEKLVVRFDAVLRMITIQLAGPDGISPVTKLTLWAAIAGDGICRFENGDIDYYFAQIDQGQDAGLMDF